MISQDRVALHQMGLSVVVILERLEIGILCRGRPGGIGDRRIIIEPVVAGPTGFPISLMTVRYHIRPGINLVVEIIEIKIISIGTIGFRGEEGKIHGAGIIQYQHDIGRRHLVLGFQGMVRKADTIFMHAGKIFAVTILIHPVSADFCRPGVNIGPGVVAVTDLGSPAIPVLVHRAQ